MRDLIIGVLQNYRQDRRRLFSWPLAIKGSSTQALVNKRVKHSLLACNYHFQNAMIAYKLQLSLTKNFKTFSTTAWWEDWGKNTPNLQKIALDILSQSCGTSKCKHKWSLFEVIPTNKHLNDLIFVQYNLHLLRKILRIWLLKSRLT